MKTLWRLSSTVLLVGLVALSGCSKLAHKTGGGGTGNDNTNASASSEQSQVVARVNGEEITIHQLNAELASVPSTPDQDADKVRQQVLRAMVYRTALRQAAVKEGLDRNPEVSILVQFAKDRILAEAYVRQQTGSTPPPTSTDISKFITDNPLQFSERRVYQFTRLTLDTDKFSDQLVPMFDQKQTFDQFEKYLNEKHIPYTLTDVRLPSSSFPKNVQNQLTKFGIGDNIVVRGGQQVSILKIKSWVDMPVEHDQATQVAENILHQQALQKRAKSLHDQVLQSAKVEFLGRFKGMSLEPPAAKPTPSAPAKGAADGKSDSSAAGPPGAPSMDVPVPAGADTSTAPQGGQAQ